jgi:hypothetical protein
MERIEIPPTVQYIGRGKYLKLGEVDTRQLSLSAVQAGMTLIAKIDTGLAKGGFKGLTYEESRIVRFILRN